LISAASNGDLDEMQSCVSAGADVNCSDTMWTPLQRATWHEHLNAVKWLVEHKANLDQTTATYHCPLAFACSNGGNIDIMSFLLLSKADPNTTHPDYRSTPLMCAALTACRYRKPALVQLLLEHKADRTCKDNKGQTALDIAFETQKGRETSETDLIVGMLATAEPPVAPPAPMPFASIG